MNKKLFKIVFTETNKEIDLLCTEDQEHLAKILKINSVPYPEHSELLINPKGEIFYYCKKNYSISFEIFLDKLRIIL